MRGLFYIITAIPSQPCDVQIVYSAHSIFLVAIAQSRTTKTVPCFDAEHQLRLPLSMSPIIACISTAVRTHAHGPSRVGTLHEGHGNTRERKYKQGQVKVYIESNRIVPMVYMYTNKQNTSNPTPVNHEPPTTRLSQQALRLPHMLTFRKHARVSAPCSRRRLPTTI